MKNKRNLNTKWLLLQNDQNADTTLLHSHDELLLLNVFIEHALTVGTHAFSLQTFNAPYSVYPFAKYKQPQ